MNSKLRKNILRKTQLCNRFKRSKSKNDWEQYRIQRNKTTDIRRASIKQYFIERCSEGPRSEHFYKTIKPFLSAKHMCDSNLMIQDGQNLLTDPAEVATCMNSFFTNIAADIGCDKNLPKAEDFPEIPDFVNAALSYHSSHPSILKINQNKKPQDTFAFTQTTADSVSKIIKALNPKKATGTDCIPAKMLIPANDILARSFMHLYNLCLETNKFPSDAKAAEIVPIYKKNDALQCKNHRPVSILTSSSKVLEKLMENDLSAQFLNDIYNDSLAAFRKNYSCQHVLLNLSDKWRHHKECSKIPGILLADLSKAFDCLPHSLITSKLAAYGFDTNSITLLTDYLSHRPQRVKTGGAVSPWSTILKGVPQGSIMGPVIFNLFMNDVFLNDLKGDIFNYADDTSVLVTGTTKDEVVNKLTECTKEIINWCNTNQMEANPAKFQAMIADESTPSTINITDSETIHTEISVKLLGVNLDNRLTFNTHIKEIIRKTSRQLNCLKRISYALPESVKLLLYGAFIGSNFNYCPAVWHMCGRANTRKLEKIQYRALKFIFADYKSDYDSLLKRANLPSLEVSRIRTIALEVFKIYLKIGPKFLQNGFNLRNTGYNLRSGPTFSRTQARTTKYGLHSFRNYGATIWNALPTSIKACSNISSFKSAIKTWYGPSCKCNFCDHTT